VHASRQKPVHSSSLFVGRDIHSDAVVWGKISMIDAEKRLLANALEDADNQFFVLLSDRFGFLIMNNFLFERFFYHTEISIYSLSQLCSASFI